MNDQQNDELIATTNKASLVWKSAFNSGDAAGCAAQYEENAKMHARPFGLFMGREAIEKFWQKLINDGFAEVKYINPQLTIENEHSVLLTSHWKMNNASGVIHKELWVLQPDGSMKLREDDFEVTS